MDQPDFRSTALPIAGATFAVMLGVGMLVPALPDLVPAGAGGAVAAGGLLSAFGAARLVMNFPAGMMADRIGIARSATIGLGILAAASLLGFAATTYALLFAAVALQGAGAATFSTSAMTALIVAGGPARRGAAMAWFQGALLLAMSVGPVIGGLLVERFGAHAPFALQAGLALLALATIRSLPKAAPATEGRPSGHRFLTLALAGGAAVCFAAFVTRIGATWNVVPTVAVADFGLTSSEVGWMLGVATLANLAVMPVSARLIDGWGAERTAALSAGLAIAGLMLMLLAPSVATLWVGTAIVMVATGAMIPSAGAAALAGVPRAATGRAMALVRMSGDVGMALGPVGIPTITAALMVPAIDGLAVAAGGLAAALAVLAAIANRPAMRSA